MVFGIDSGNLFRFNNLQAIRVKQGDIVFLRLLQSGDSVLIICLIFSNPR